MRRVSRRAVLWVGFAVVHVGVAVLGWLLPNQPMGDVYLVYEPWSTRAVEGTAIVGVTESWVYPHLALVPMVLAKAMSWLGGYEIAWAVVVTAADAVAFAVLVGRGRSSGRWIAAWFWLVFIALLGPVGIYRLEGVTTPLALAACLWLVGRPALASVLLTIGMWIKVWPAALLASAVVAVRRRRAIAGTSIALSAVILLMVLSAGAGAHALGFVAGQTDRGLQLEAPVSGYYLWRAVLGYEDSFIYYDQAILTFQVTGPSVDIVIAAMTPVLVIAVIGVLVLGIVKMWRGATFAGLFPSLGLATVAAMILFNKVGSPQYLSWIIAPLVVGLVIDRWRWWGPALLGLGTALLTQIVYPLTYGELLVASAFPTVVLTLRNLALAVLFVWAVVRVARTPTHPRVKPRAAASASPSPTPTPTEP
jgi:hypothetical protein